MKISHTWLQTFFDKPLPEIKELADALTFHAFEIESVEGDLLDVKVTPNRGHDCLSHRGIAKELSAILNVPLAHDPLIAQESAGTFSMEFPVTVSIEDPELCSRYIAWRISGVKVGPSPAWLKERLESIGERSINNVVDATNFVMFNIGQPLHAFDADRLRAQGPARAISVRKAHKDEKMTGLDGKEYALDESTLVIADGVADEAIGIAGIKGGKASEVSPVTTNIVLESANFHGASIRKSSRTLKLRTDASDRFQQVLSPELPAYGIRAAARLIIEIAGGQLSGFADVYPKPQEKKDVIVSTRIINDVLGTKLDEKVIVDALTRLGFSLQTKDGLHTISVPFERLDIELPEDIVEEVARIVGYDAIPSVDLPTIKTKPEVNKIFYAAERAREDLISEGYSEVYTSVFADKGGRIVANKVDGVRPYLRESLLSGLAEAVEKNVLNRIENVKLFEIGIIWKDKEEHVMVGQASGDAPAKEEVLSIPKKIPSAYEDLPLTAAVRYESFSKYPFIVRDIALWVPSETKPEDVLAVLREHGDKLLVRSALFDQFQKDAKTSLAFHLIFQSFEKTLTDEEVNKIMHGITKAVEKKSWTVR